MLSFLAAPVAFLLKTIHSGLASFLNPSSGWAWGLSIILLTVVVRLALFPLFVKQIKSQRRMQQLAPLVKELQKKHKGDRETLNAEMMKLYKVHNANPISGCLPLVLQLPVFFALFSVMREFKPGAKPKFGLSAQLLEQGGSAKVFGAPISAGFKSSHDFLAALGANATNVRIVAVIMIVIMGATTFWTQRQMMARAGAVTDPNQVMVQRVMLYVLPLSFAVSGQFFPIGVLLYWLTTNFWSMGQQHYVIKRMPPIEPGTPGGTVPVSLSKEPEGKSSAGPKGGGRKGAGPQTAGPKDLPSGVDGPATALEGDLEGELATAGATASTALAGGPAARRQDGSRKKKNGRRGGRR